jgi:hypothetical protein
MVLGAIACGNPVSLEAETGVAATDQLRTAVLFVEREETDAAARAHVGAQFIEFTGIPADALPDLLGSPRVLDPAVGCFARDGNTGVETTSNRAEARLLDVGPIDVRAGDRLLRLEPRQFPDMWNVVSGVIYATDEDLPGDTWRFTAAGNELAHLDGFDVELRAPETLSHVTFADQELTPGGSVTLGRHAFAVRWARGDLNDVVTVTFQGNSQSAASVTCVARDEGVIEIDQGWADRVMDLVSESGSVSVHRVRSRAFSAGQLDNAQLVFDVSLRGTLHAE